MNNEDMSDIIKKINTMVNMSNIQKSSKINKQSGVSSNSNNINEDTIKDLIKNFNITNNNSNNNVDSEKTNNQNNNSNFNFDINTILKIKTIIDKMNSNNNDPRSNLLSSLKPYLNNDRKQKLDQYIQFLNISKIIEALNSENGVDSKWQIIQII